MTDHNDLAERIERADGPDRALDGEIVEMVKGGMRHPWYVTPPAFTGSNDAAMQLVPEGWVFNVGNDTAFCWAHVWDDTPDYDGEPFEGHACTLPLAICAAAIRAQVQP